MMDSSESDWIQLLRSSFSKKGLPGEDFFYVIVTMLQERRVSFLEMMSSAAQGHGVRVHEGLEYVLEQDLEDPIDFDGVIFVIGEFESSTLPVVEFVELLEMACREYVEHFPGDEIRIFSNLARVKAKYLTRSGCSSE